METYISYTENGSTFVAKAKPYNDAFYEIVEGRNPGDLIHIFKVKYLTKEEYAKVLHIDLKDL